ncbi:MAG: LysR family transcriptional regulator [Oscillospiraceae bacterium]|nr:LysR family transcriptional regulator [Oscillospiraceae bacterium]
MLGDKLDTLLTVYELGSFTRAAEKLSLTQPAVSHQIGQIEDALGVKIFHRRKGELKLTPEGEIAVRYARRIKALYARMLQRISDEREMLRRLTVGITHTAESGLIAEVLAKYASENPGVSITILTDTINNLYDRMASFELDLAFVEGRQSDPAVNSLLLDTDYLVCVAAPEHPFAKKRSVTIAELQRERLILRLPSSGTRGLFLSNLERVGLTLQDFNVILEVDSIATIKDLVRRNFGVSILARSACLDELSKGKLTALPIENLSMIRETNILYHRDFSYPDVLEALTRIYHDMARSYK